MLGNLHKGPITTYSVQVLPINNPNVHQYNCHPPKTSEDSKQDESSNNYKGLTTVSGTNISVFKKLVYDNKSIIPPTLARTLVQDHRVENIKNGRDPHM